MFSIYILCIFVLLLFGMYAFLSFLEKRIFRFEQKIIQIFVSRSDVFPSLYQSCKDKILRQDEIFYEIMELRKKEFAMTKISKSLEAFLELEAKLHHELNFIFQICHKNRELHYDKTFLHIQDVIISKSHDISDVMKTYRGIISIYNKIIRIKNYTIIGLILPFYKKPLL